MQRFLSFSSRFVFCSVFLGAMLSFTATSQAQLPVESGQAAGAPSLMAQQVADLQKVVDRWDDAIDQHDQYALELVLSPEFISISDMGEVANRDQVVAEMLVKDAPKYTLAQKVLSVREVGDLAVINGTYDRTYQGSRLSHRKMKEEKGVFSQVYVRARNSWECINSQYTLIVATETGKKKSKTETTAKPLNHDLQFHFPGMHHSGSPDTSPQQ